MKTLKYTAIILSILGASILGKAQCLTSDSLALVDFYNATGGASWTNTWNLNDPVNTWYGVTLDATQCKVECLDLDGNLGCTFSYSPGNNLVGDVAALANLNLPDLRKIYLSHNQLYGTIPDFTGLDDLLVLDIAYNQLTGPIPDFSISTSLSQIILKVNQLSGPLPEFTNLANLRSLYLNHNELSGSIVDFNYSPNLEKIYLADNKLGGTIPSFSNLSQIEELRLEQNELTASLLDFTGLPLLDSLTWGENHLNFDDLRPMQTHDSFPFPLLTYAPQKFIGKAQTLSADQGETLLIHLERQFGGNDIMVQWFKDGTPLGSPTLNDSIYTINTLELDDIGIYTAQATSSSLPGLTLTSASIAIFVNGFDANGQPVFTDQLIIEFKDDFTANEIDSIHQELATNYLGILVKSCNCDRNLELWSFDSTINILEIPIGPSEKHKSRGTGPRVDGDFNRGVLDFPDDGSIENWTWNTSETPMVDSVLVYIIDSGIDTTNNPALTNFLLGTPNTDCDGGGEWGTNFTDPNSSQNILDSMGHGTAVADISTRNLSNELIGIKALKVFDETGYGQLFDLVCAFHKSIDEEADIINFSGGYRGDTSLVLQEVINRAEQAGILIVAAAGNQGIDIDVDPYWPASFPNENLIVVTAIDDQDLLPDFANYGAINVDLAAFGVGVEAYGMGGNVSTITGTSASAPLVTRALAQELSNPAQNWQSACDSVFARLIPLTSLVGKSRLEAKLDVFLESEEVYCDLRILLQGPLYEDNGVPKMQTTLANEYHLLPGQESDYYQTPFALPYEAAPWYYGGNELNHYATQDYESTAVDWVLLSFRTDISSNSTIRQMAGLLQEDGRIRFFEPLFGNLNHGYDSLYIVVEHRNHLNVMSPQKVAVEGNYLRFDFSQQDSYSTNGTGQILVGTNQWAMAGGDMYQTVDPAFGQVDSYDRLKYFNYVGLFGRYHKADINMDGSIDGNDRVILEGNNGIFSAVPK